MDTNLLLKVRDISIKHGISNLNFENLSTLLGIEIDELKKNIPDIPMLVEDILKYEREAFTSIFDKYNFNGINAIEILLTVSREINLRFADLSPSMTHELKVLYPDIYQKHMEERVDFIFEKIKINIQKGIAQGLYRKDLSIELLSRIYISRLIDLHNPMFFPPDKFSFKLLFEVMFENFIRGIATEEGLQYYSTRMKEIKKADKVTRI